VYGRSSSRLVRNGNPGINIVVIATRHDRPHADARQGNGEGPRCRRRDTAASPPITPWAAPAPPAGDRARHLHAPPRDELARGRRRDRRDGDRRRRGRANR